VFRGGGLAKHFRNGQGGCRKSQRHGSKEVTSIHLRNGKGSTKNAQHGDRMFDDALENVTGSLAQFQGSSKGTRQRSPHFEIYIFLIYRIFTLAVLRSVYDCRLQGE